MAARPVEQFMQNRQDKGSGLAGAGLGGADDILAGQDGRDRRGLDGGRIGVAGASNPLRQAVI